MDIYFNIQSLEESLLENIFDPEINDFFLKSNLAQQDYRVQTLFLNYFLFLSLLFNSDSQFYQEGLLVSQLSRIDSERLGEAECFQLTILVLGNILLNDNASSVEALSNSGFIERVLDIYERYCLESLVCNTFWLLRILYERKLCKQRIAALYSLFLQAIIREKSRFQDSLVLKEILSQLVIIVFEEKESSILSFLF